MDSPILSVGLPLMLAVVMYGLGLSLTTADFRRVATQPKAVLIALICQVLVLPAVAFGLAWAFKLDPILAIGFMLLAASPGGTTANLYSHLFRGDVALNVSLTAINSVLAVVTLPVITNMAIAYFDSANANELTLQFDKVVQVFAVVLIPVVLGMLTRAKAPGFADRMDKPVRIASVVMLVALVFGAIIGERENVMDYFASIGAVAILFCVISLSIGYFVPRAFGIREGLAIASAMEIGIHNTTVAMTIAIAVMDSVELAVPAAVYSVVMYIFAAAFGFLITRGDKLGERVSA
ncbi:bile acid:sodium symporter family protein [Tomitella biformata]|uniref:bile acid:sodium symporter family protein n=1 Tax=Tomitella biformata TaxID=630403 RepID=UPI0004651C1C|nr:bile acid:sodium symporter family protein [Tomitella biformata]